MADRVQAYNHASVPWRGSHSEGAPEGDFNRRPYPRRAATSLVTPTNSLMNPSLGQAAYPPPSPYPGRHPQTTHRSDIFFSPHMNYTRFNPHNPTDPANDSDPVPNAAQLYPLHQHQYYGHINQHNQVRTSSPASPVPLPPKPPALQQEMRQDTSHGPLHPGMYRSFTSPPAMPPKPALLFESDSLAIPTNAYLGNSQALTPGAASTPSSATSSPPPPVPPLPSGVPVAGPSTAEPQQREEEDDGNDELAVALALSKDESMREEERIKELARLEEEEFERALAASMSLSSGGFEFYESQPGAGPSNWATAVVQSPLPMNPPDLLQETRPFASASSLSFVPETSPKVPSPQSPESAGEPKTENTAKELEPVTLETMRVSSFFQSMKPCSHDATLTNGTTSPDHDEVLLICSSKVTDQTPTASSFPPDVHSEPEPPKSGTPKDNDNDDEYNGDELLYLLGTRESLSVSIPQSKPSVDSRRPRLSPVSASFIDLAYDDSYIDEDEALARRLAEEEEKAAQRESQQNVQAPADNHLSRNSSLASSTWLDTPSDLPTYNDIISIARAGPPSRKSTFVPDTRDSPGASVPDEKAELGRNRSLNSVTSVSIASGSSHSPVLLPSDGPPAVPSKPNETHRVIGRVSSMSALPPSHPPPGNDLPLTPVDDLAAPTNHLFLNPKSVHFTATSANGSNNISTGSSSAGTSNANHYIDTELLHGVSMNFTPPVISPKLTPMQGQMPTLISLPYGRCPPLHFQAPSWRHMLKLMARLSGAKMEPSIEAMAVTKSEVLKLRTVVQFIKPHHMANEWRTILWFTIDHPVSPNAPNASKYKDNSTNVNVLPFSYTLSSVPAMLRDASDTALSKTYTIPATCSVPYPSLPITFPNLALYLQAALDDSRRQSESNSLHKLAKMVQTCYPHDLASNDTDEPGKSSGVSGLFKKVMGRGGKKGKKGGGGGNEDTYDLVTPFVPDEWG